MFGTSNYESMMLQGLLVTLSAVGGYSAYRDYQNYMGLGAGGAPHNVALEDSFGDFYQKNKHLLKTAPSLHEKRDDALFLADTIAGNQPIAKQMLREVAHIHKTGDHSLHIALPPQDCKEVIRAGWGQRHALSGGTILTRIGINRFYLPMEYILIYSPRNRAEIETVMRLVQASTAYLARVPIETVEI
ncbi:hypothetical protein CLAIMM_15086 [Cladophialophora immunda]|nr:hypothetical protein CLAIMM_15086 [Cladophialophora immunda]